ncbi:MAG: hypothetical protein JST01_21910 [Cyanobacteria bacterium SZAS TMP-1]|nr:hypothetical protein [Cyanobacteria bacterium SZAS TMP-1]
MTLARLPRFPFELIPIILYGVMLFGAMRVYFDSPRCNFYFIILASVLPWISLSWAVVFNGGSWKKPTVFFALYVVALSVAMLVMTWLSDGPQKFWKDNDPSYVQLFLHETNDGRIVAVDNIAGGGRTSVISVYKDKRLAAGLWLRSLIFNEQIYDIDHFAVKDNELDIVTGGKVPETKKIPL